jgi:alkylhydroperoxidase/carboxymuconolactone decarboxylase family protein YurZ
MYDMKNLAKLKLLDANAPEGMKAFWAFDKAAMAEGAIPVKYKELIALGVGALPRSAHIASKFIRTERAKRGRQIRRLPKPS